MTRCSSRSWRRTIRRRRSASARTPRSSNVPTAPDLFRDLQALQVATRALPAPVRRRDFRLTEADAARLHRPSRLAWLDSGWRAWLQWLAGPRFAFSQQLGTGLAALGIAGLLFATVPGLLGVGNISTVLSTAGAPIGPSRVSAEAPTDQGTGKSGADGAEPTSPNPSAESIAGGQSAGPSAAGVAAPQAGSSLPALAGPSAAPPAVAAAPTSAPTTAPTAAPTAAPADCCHAAAHSRPNGWPRKPRLRPSPRSPGCRRVSPPAGVPPDHRRRAGSRRSSSPPSRSSCLDSAFCWLDGWRFH